MPSSIPTAPERDGLREGRTDRRWRRVALTGLGVVVVLGLAGVWGVRARTLHASSPGTTARLTYPQVVRPGLAAPWRVHVERAGGFDGSVTITVTSEYLDSFDQNGLTPQPDRTWRDATTVSFGFDEVAGDAIELSLDMRLEPGVQWRRRATTEVIIGDEVVASWSYTTWVVP